MKDFLIKILAVFLLGFAIYQSFTSFIPGNSQLKKEGGTEFSVQRAFHHVEKIAEKPHFIGSEHHAIAREYIVEEVKKLGLQPEIQKAYTMNKGYRVITEPINIICRIPGREPRPGSDLLILSHYDSAVHSSYGASDDGAGVAAVLESLRALLAGDLQNKNNIIVCFTDAEEIGLVGAQLFADQNPLVENIGLVLNFEARGSQGPSNTILETNHGNAQMVQAFAKAKSRYPMASSLMYSIYKNLPNDTDATVFRKDKDIPSFFFAFIDGHYNYHTATDNTENLSLNSLAHQGTYLMDLIPYFSQMDLSQLKTEKDRIYFNIPGLRFVHYSHAWIIPFLLVGWITFFILVIWGIRRGSLNMASLLQGSLIFLFALIATGGIGYLGWKFILFLYPQYHEILHGFPYNGHSYILAFVITAFSVLLWLYHRPMRLQKPRNLLIAPLLIWLIINTYLAVSFQGASYFIIPILCTEIILALLIKFKKPNIFILIFLSLSGIYLLIPLISFLPIALGMKTIYLSLTFMTLIFGLLTPVFEQLSGNRSYGSIGFILAIIVFGWTHFQSNFNESRPKPNSLIYELDWNQQSASWNTYDRMMDSWNSQFITGDQKAGSDRITEDSKYGSNYTYSNTAAVIPVPMAEFITLQDSGQLESKSIELHIIPRRKVNRITLWSPDISNIKNMQVQGIAFSPSNQLQAKASQSARRTASRLFTYFAAESDTLRVHFQINEPGQPVIFDLQETSHDLLDNPWIKVKPRDTDMIPRPFVSNDAIITWQRIVANQN